MTRSATGGSQNREFAEEAGPSKPAVIPTGNVVILRESELDCDLSTAIERVRADDKSKTARILVIGSEDQAYEQGLEDRELPPPAAPMTPVQFSRGREALILEEAGNRIQPLLACLERFNAETKEVLLALDEEVTDQTRARLKNRIATLCSIHEWVGAVAEDLTIEAQALVEGRSTVDTREVCEEMGRQVEARFPGIRVMSCRGPSSPKCWGRAIELAEALYLALGLVAQRIGGVGRIHVEIEQKDGFVVHRIAGDGEPREIDADEWVQRFRSIVVEGHGGRIQPDLTGQGGTGISLELPAPA